MNIIDKVLYSICFATLIASLRIIFMWGHTSKYLGIGLAGLAIFIMYINYLKTEKKSNLVLETNQFNILLGISLIFIDVGYNVYTNDAFRSFDYGMILSGLLIVLINTNILSFLRLNKQTVSFVTYFIFILMMNLSFLGKGITYIYSIFNPLATTNPLYDVVTASVIKISSFFLNIIKPTTQIGNLINFDGYVIGIAYPCSGIESMTLFLAAILAYFIANKEKNIKRVVTITLLGTLIFYISNIVRIITIILVGYYMGNDAMLFTHNNLGWIFFAIGMGIIWYYILGKNGNYEN